MDSYSRGLELELSSKPMKGLTLRFTASYTDRARINVYGDIVDFFNQYIPIWMKQADPSKNGGYEYLLPESTIYLYDFLLDRLYNTGGNNIDAPASAVTSVRDNLNEGIRRQSGAMGNRKMKFNFTARYNIQRGSFKGFTLGGAVRYSCPNLMPDPYSPLLSLQTVTRDDHPDNIMFDPTVYTNEKTMIKGQSLLFYDAFASYKRKLFGGRATMTLQVNIKNIFDQCVVTEGQYQRAFNNEKYLRRVYINPPRSLLLTAIFDF
jgi:outer membrane receptor protein involved in Fe transport